LVQHTKTGKNIPNNHKMATKYTKWLQNKPNGYKINQTAIKYTYEHLLLQDPPKFTQIVIFGLTIHHLATLNSGPI
jgi:hypothetical protein